MDVGEIAAAIAAEIAAAPIMAHGSARVIVGLCWPEPGSALDRFVVSGEISDAWEVAKLILEDSGVWDARPAAGHQVGQLVDYVLTSGVRPAVPGWDALPS